MRKVPGITNCCIKREWDSGTKIVIDFYDTNDKGRSHFETTRRPIINGGGTYSTGTFKRAISGAVQLVNQEYWDISNLEVTNTS